MVLVKIIGIAVLLSLLFVTYMLHKFNRFRKTATSGTKVKYWVGEEERHGVIYRRVDNTVYIAEGVGRIRSYNINDVQPGWI